MGIGFRRTGLDVLDEGAGGGVDALVTAAMTIELVFPTVRRTRLINVK